jgi:hypothetical protein
MATMLRETDSTNKHLNGSARHMRLCRQAGQTALAEAILPVHNALSDKQKASKAASEAREQANDDMIYSDGDLDGAVHTAFDETKRHDRESPGDRATERTFPDGKFTTITMTKTTEEPDEVDKLALRFESFGASHPLYAIAARLREKAAVSRTKVNAYKEAIKAENKAQADEQIAKFELRRKYEHNYLDARKLLGRTMADRLFPRIGGGGSSGPGDEETPPSDSQNA